METIVNGMDLDKLEAFRKSLKKHPVALGLEAMSIWEGHSGRSTVHIAPYKFGGQRIERATRHYTIAYGSWREVEESVGFVGPTDRAEPVEMALGALAACLAASIALNAPRHGIKLEAFEIEVSCNLDPSVLLEIKGPESHTTCMSNITTETRVKGKITDQQLKTIERLIHHSPVLGLIERVHKVKSNVTRARHNGISKAKVVAALPRKG
jgi:uncharacterized OsmC-like protein